MSLAVYATIAAALGFVGIIAASHVRSQRLADIFGFSGLVLVIVGLSLMLYRLIR